MTTAGVISAELREWKRTTHVPSPFHGRSVA
jgi:hypothetical protein